MQCPRCGTEGNGAYCAACGARLEATESCRRCGSALPAGARYCVQCGARAGRARDAMRYALPGALVALALAAGWWLGGRGDAAQDPAGAGAAAPALGITPAAPGTPPPLTGSLRDQADRLFERIMQARAAGDQEQVEFFLPMALQAYQGVGDLDADGLFHLGLLLIQAGRTSDAIETAQHIAQLDEDHLFADALTADAALADGDSTAARRAFARFLENFDAQIPRPLPEYEMHRPALDGYRSQARQLVEQDDVD